MSEPTLMRSGLTGAVYIVTRYKAHPENPSKFEAQTKYDVTESFREFMTAEPVFQQMREALVNARDMLRDAADVSDAAIAAADALMEEK